MAKSDILKKALKIIISYFKENPDKIEKVIEFGVDMYSNIAKRAKNKQNKAK